MKNSHFTNDSNFYALIMGGNSSEHEVSLMTGYSISKILTNKYTNLLFIGITKKNNWYYSNDINSLINDSHCITKININSQCDTINQIGKGKINNVKIKKVILATHGNNVEDGKLQSYLEYNELEYTGNKVEISLVCFNKYLSKLIALSSNVQVLPYMYVSNNENINNIEIWDENIVKINRGGSSIGVYYSSKYDIEKNIKKAFELDNSILIEKYIDCRELSIGILFDNKKICYSKIGEYFKNSEICKYNDKYIKDDSYCLIENLDHMIIDKITQYSKILINILNITNYARIDFFLDKQTNIIYFNEINTLPGLSENSLFVKLWSHQYSYSELLQLIINE